MFEKTVKRTLIQEAQLRNRTRRKSKWRLFFCELYQIRYFEEVYWCEMSK